MEPVNFPRISETLSVNFPWNLTHLKNSAVKSCIFFREFGWSLSIRHSWSVSKRCKLESRNLYCWLHQGLHFFVTKFCVPGWGGSTRTRVSKGVPPKKHYFAAIGLSSVKKTVADRHTHAAYHNKHWWRTIALTWLEIELDSRHPANRNCHASHELCSNYLLFHNYRQL